MKKKNSITSKEANASDVKNLLNTASTYSSDRPLFKTLGLMFFTDIPTGKEYFVGEVEFKNGSIVKIWVCATPAQFWKFEIFVAQSFKTTNVSTGSGTLENFWNSIKLIAEDMLDVEKTEFKK